jgi:hypothetical protein
VNYHFNTRQSWRSTDFSREAPRFTRPERGRLRRPCL